MSANAMTRKDLFRAALRRARLTRRAFAAEVGVTDTHLAYVLRGDRTSARLTRIIDALIDAYLDPEERDMARAS